MGQSSRPSTYVQPAPFIYINGYPGIGKLTIAKELSSLIEYSKVISNHLTIDAAAAICPRHSQEYYFLRKSFRQLQFSYAIEAPTQTAWIFTDSSSEESKISQEYQAAAGSRGSHFIPIVLTCKAEENFERITGVGRGRGLNTKLTDTDVLCQIRETETVFRFRNEEEMELDVTNLTAAEAAMLIFEHIFR